MKTNVKIDFQLNRQFGIAERLIFRLVLNGFTDIRDIVKTIPVFSDSVIANGIKTLVNRQILTVNNKAGRLSLAEPIVAIIEKCLEKDSEIIVPTEIANILKGNGLIISSSVQKDVKSLKRAILYELLPGIRLDMYMDSLDFMLYEDKRGGLDE